MRRAGASKSREVLAGTRCSGFILKLTQVCAGVAHLGVKGAIESSGLFVVSYLGRSGSERAQKHG